MLSTASVLQPSMHGTLYRQNALKHSSKSYIRSCRSSFQVTKAGLFDWAAPASQEEKDDAFKAQQEVLQRRRQGSWQKDVVERRKDVSRYLRDPVYKKEVDEEKRKRFKAKQAEVKDPGVWGIIIPVAPFGMPEYDGGERFDLRLPYVDNGWVDDDADFFKNVKNLFGDKKTDETDGKADAKKGKKK